MEKIKLSSDERELCSLIRDAGLANHFAEERIDIDRKIGKITGSATRKQMISEVLHSVQKLITTMENEGRANISGYTGEDQHLVRYTFLFDIFHKHIAVFDQHILDQVRSGDVPLSVPFAQDAFAMFRTRGFLQQEAVLFFAVFFQLRRAYFFIEKQLVGICPSMQRLRTSLWNNIFTCDPIYYVNKLLARMEDFSTLILGDTGTGKGTAASAIGRSGFIPFNEKSGKFADSFTKAFVSLNLSQFSEGLLESELFGHRKGAFTGAIEEHQGIFDTCSKHGSIFLDEIGDISIPVQIKLLTVLQERTFTPVGSHQKKRFSGRVIAATNKNLVELREKGLFRDDFYYRLCSDIIQMPSLHERIQENGAELDILIRHVINAITGDERPELAETVVTLIEKQLGHEYAWPGNVRELEQCVRRIIIRRAYEGDLRKYSSTPGTELVDAMLDESLTAENLLAKYCTILYEKYHSFEAVRKIVQLDRRTVKRYIKKDDSLNNE